MREAATRRLEADETALRHRVSIDIPALSHSARAVLEKVRDAIDRNDLSAALGFALADRISVMVYGRIVATGTADEIRTNALVREAYLGDAA